MTQQQPDLDAVARAILDANHYMTLGTADAAGNPWVSPVFFAADRYRDLYWISSPEATHSRNLGARPELSIVVFDSQAPVGTGQAVYMAATAAELSGADLERGLRVYPGEAGLRAGARTRPPRTSSRPRCTGSTGPPSASTGSSTPPPPPTSGPRSTRDAALGRRGRRRPGRRDRRPGPDAARALHRGDPPGPPRLLPTAPTGAPEQVLALALALVDRRRWVAYELVSFHPGGLACLDAGRVERLGRGLDGWAAVDAFGCIVAGPAWRLGRVPDATIQGWAAAADRWWRRAALVSTVPLNLRSRGGDTAHPGHLRPAGRRPRRHGGQGPVVGPAGAGALGPGRGRRLPRGQRRPAGRPGPPGGPYQVATGASTRRPVGRGPAPTLAPSARMAGCLQTEEVPGVELVSATWS